MFFVSENCEARAYNIVIIHFAGIALVYIMYAARTYKLKVRHRLFLRVRSGSFSPFLLALSTHSNSHSYTPPAQPFACAMHIFEITAAAAAS